MWAYRGERVEGWRVHSMAMISTYKHTRFELHVYSAY